MTYTIEVDGGSEHGGGAGVLAGPARHDAVLPPAPRHPSRVVHGAHAGPVVLARRAHHALARGQVAATQSGCSQVHSSAQLSSGLGTNQELCGGNQRKLFN